MQTLVLTKPCRTRSHAVMNSRRSMQQHDIWFGKALEKGCRADGSFSWRFAALGYGAGEGSRDMCTSYKHAIVWASFSEVLSEVFGFFQSRGSEQFTIEASTLQG